jgi:alpha-amylase
MIISTHHTCSYTNDTSLAKNAIAFLFFTDGIPIIYAGQEQHYNGGNDPANREALWLSRYDTSSKLYTFIASTNAIRTFAINNDPEYLTYKVISSYQALSPISSIRKTSHTNPLFFHALELPYLRRQLHNRHA